MGVPSPADWGSGERREVAKYPKFHPIGAKMWGLGPPKLKILLQLEIRSVERGICPIATLALHLTLYSLTGSRFDP